MQQAPTRGDRNEHRRPTDGETVGTASTGPGDLKLEVVIIPVADADRSKALSDGLGWRLDADFSYDNGVRVVHADGTAMTVEEHRR
jgi:hypothetical protein